MKKILTFILVGLIIFSFTGCAELKQKKLEKKMEKALVGDWWDTEKEKEYLRDVYSFYEGGTGELDKGDWGDDREFTWEIENEIIKIEFKEKNTYQGVLNDDLEIIGYKDKTLESYTRAFKLDIEDEKLTSTDGKIVLYKK